MTALSVGSLVLALLAIGALQVLGAPRFWTLLGGAELLALWLLGLIARRPGVRALRLLPGHALLLFAIGRTQNTRAFFLWLSAMALTFALLVPRPQVRFLWAILWPVLVGTIHQAGAAKFSEHAFWAWTAGLALLASILTAREVRTIIEEKG